MKGFFFKILVLIPCLLAFNLSHAHEGDTIVSDGARYRVLDGDSAVSLVACDDVESLVIPATLQHKGTSYKVVSIEQQAFSGNSSISKLSLPSTLKQVEDGAFNSCQGINTIFSHVPDASVVLPHIPAGALLAVDGDYINNYSQHSGPLYTLVNVDDNPRSANLCDVNHDGAITASDITQVYDYLLGYGATNGDANGDGIVTSSDITAIYDDLLEGNTSGVGDQGYCFATINKTSCLLETRVAESISLAVGSEICIVAHDNEKPGPITSGFNIMKGTLPETEDIELSNGVHAISFSNKHYNTGGTANAVMYFSTPTDTIYYKEVEIKVAQHTVTDTLRVLSIGNSFSLDALSYVPFIMNSVAPQIYLKLDIMYIGGGSLNEFYNALDSTTWAPVDEGTPTNFIHYWSHGAKPWDARRDVPMTSVIDSHPWDVIVLQQQSNASRDYSTYQPYLSQIIDWLDEKVTWEHQYAWLITPSYPDNLPRLAPDTSSVQMFERILECVRNVQNDTGIELLLPCGTAIQNARTTPLDSLGDFGHLFDYLHLQDGIPCLIEAYAATAALLARYGLSDRVWTDTTWINQQWLHFNNIQEINGLPVGMSEENRAIAKQCAIKALENPLSITTIE